MRGTSPLIVVNRHTPQAEEAFSRLGRVRALASPQFTPAAVRDADVMVVRSETVVDARLLEGSTVRFVGTVTIGTDHVDLEYLASRGITFASAPGSNSRSVAEYMAAALLSWSRRTGLGLQGRTIGIVGVGNVGSKVIGVAQALGMEVLENDPPLARSTGNPRFLPLDDLMHADFISLHVPLTDSGADATVHLFDAARIARMKKGAVLINTSRGPVVDTGALKLSLASGYLSCAVLDVWENEPDIDVGLLRQAMIGTPHIAGYSLDGKLNAVRMIYEALCRSLGVDDAWPDLPLRDSGEIGPIRVPEQMTGKEEILRYCVSAGYDIEGDDTRLRKMATLRTEDRARHFMMLRAEYPVRREFSKRSVELLLHQDAAAQALIQLGFPVRMREPGA